MTRTVTVKDIATALAPVDDVAAKERILRRIRYWTKEGVLSAFATAPAAGTGHYRRYRPGVVYWAALVSEMNNYSLTAEMLKTGILRLWSRVREVDDNGGGNPWEDAIYAKRDVVVVFYCDFEKQIVSAWIDPDTTEIPDPYTSALTIKLTKIFSRVRR